MNRRAFNRNLAGTLLSGFPVPATTHPARAQSAGTETRETAPFDISVMLWTVFRNLSFETRLEKVAEAGYRNVELVGEYAEWADSDFARVNTQCKQLGIRFDCTAGLKHGLTNPGEREQLIGELRRTIPVMERLDCPAIILLSGDRVAGLSLEAQQQSCVDGLRAAAAVVNGKRINGQPLRILLENIDPEENPNYFLTSAARGLEIVKAVGHSQVQFLYDFFHEQIAEGNLIEKLEKNIDYVGLVHVADVPGRHQPGSGEINYGNIFGKLAELNYRNMVAMEFLPRGDAVFELRRAREMALRTGSRTAAPGPSA
jgi:hydroxypyruvate isomerase